MAATVTKIVSGPPQFGLVDVTLDNSYPTGGYPITAAQLGFNRILGVIVMSHPSGYTFEYDAANNKLKAYRVNTTAAALSEVPNATSLTGINVHLLVVGA